LDDLIGKGDGRDSALALFHETASNVPAYGEFLKEHKIDPKAIATPNDLSKIPPVKKENYVLRYPLKDLCRNGDLAGQEMVAVSSGSTGKPTFWLRTLQDELGVAVRFEQIFHDSFQADQRSTLAVICFALGTWVGGIYTANCSRHLAAKGYQVTVVTPGNNREEIFRVMQDLAPLYDQVVLLGYPPFIKDVIDTGIARGIEWKRHRICMVFAGEVFSEEWRELVCRRVGSERPWRDTASLYGTADAGVLGNETPVSILIRRHLAAHPDLARELFGQSRLPTIVQYDPTHRFFEVDDGRLLFSGDNGIPLVRYNILDTGGVMGFAEMTSLLKEHGWDMELGGAERVRGVRPLPFVWVFGRSDFTVSYFGANVFPENITVGLEQPEIQDWVTGKFVLQVMEDEDANSLLSLVVEMTPAVEPSEERRRRIEESVLIELLRLNSEFANYVPTEHRRVHTRLTPAGDPEYFPVGVKHRYTRR
jgi:phenylacetate-CoA ligase